ncbi:cytochrome P450 [Novosphingobium sp. AP12]|uniref:cytochrome P450 n=1 Tax=Novosphingobium sp. AP12 TaxID=1144305 RepID=UPI000271E7BD|nr:cytochrome P450 [Novosphingobium sp. AP12]EJL23171.1 cytochrome P450 [Novosphingobium sp. AP12]
MPETILHGTITGTETRLDPAIRNAPFPFYRALREQRPVYYDPGLDVWLVTRYDDARTVLGDSVTYSLEHGYQDRFANGHVEEFAAILEAEGGGFIRDLAIDPPAHTRLRRLTEKAFTAHRVKTLEPRIRRIAIDLIEPLATRGRGDGIGEIGAPLTAHLICDQLGLDFASIGTERIAWWTTAVLAQIGRMQTRDEMVVNARTICDLQNTIIAEIKHRQSNPREDMISDLVNARLDDEAEPQLTFAELVATVRAFLIAGNDTTAAGIANILHVLATTEGLADELYPQVEDDRTMARFVEEVMRLHAPVHGLFRTTMRQVELGGATIPAMAQICVMYAAANYDEAAFPEPTKLDIARPNVGANLTFGAGIHKCVGIALARMEMKVAAQEIIRRLTDIRLAVPESELTFLPTLATHTFTALPLTFRRRTA